MTAAVEGRKAWAAQGVVTDSVHTAGLDEREAERGAELESRAGDHVDADHGGGRRADEAGRAKRLAAPRTGHRNERDHSSGG
jgi:hypothetical protein